MKIDNDFDLNLDPADAYELLADIGNVAPCMPGAELGEPTDDGGQSVTVTVKLGPMRFVYAGVVKIEDSDAGARRATMHAKAREKKGGGTAEARIVMQVREREGGGSHVTSSTDMSLTGRAAQSGRGIVEDVSKRMVGQMAECLNSRYGAADGGLHAGAGAAASPPAAKPIGGAGLILRVLGSRLREFVRRFRDFVRRIFGRGRPD